MLWNSGSGSNRFGLVLSGNWLSIFTASPKFSAKEMDVCRQPDFL